MLAEAGSFVLGIVIVKGFVEPLVKRQSRRLAHKYVPPLLDKLDPVMPEVIARYSSDEIREYIFTNLLGMESGLNDEQKHKVVDQTMEAYNPLINADKLKAQKESK